MPTARLSHASLYYELTGEGPPLLCIMGLGVPLEGYARQRQALSDGRQVIVFDNRGVGRSSVPRPPYRIEDLARDALELLDHLAIARADVLGISMGGMIAQHMAVAAPERVNALVLAATFARADLHLRLRVLGITRRALQRFVLAGLGGQRSFERALRPVWESMVVPGPKPPDTVELLDAAWLAWGGAPRPDLGALGQLWAVLTHDCADALAGIRAPTMIIGGSADQLSLAGHAQDLARRIPGARLEILAGAPHGLNMVAAHAFNAAVKGFLDRHSPAASPA